jgi:predicted solute-binding protein
MGKRGAKKRTKFKRPVVKKDLGKEYQFLEQDLNYIRKHLDKLWEYATEAKDRLQDLEIQANLITRLLTTLSLDVLKLKPKALRRMIKKVEEEAIADSQVMHLEELFRLEPGEKKNGEEKKS